MKFAPGNDWRLGDNAERRRAGGQPALVCFTRRRFLNPAELLHRQSGVPDFRHVPDPLAVEVHHIHIVGLHPLARWWAWATLAGMSAGEDAVGTNARPLIVSSKRLQL